MGTPAQRDPATKPAWLRTTTIVWALVVVAVLVCTATGVVTLFGSKFGPLFGASADALAGPDGPVVKKVGDGGT